MATQSININAFQTLCAECSDAIADEDWKTAYSKYAQAEAVNAALELEVSGQGSSVTRRQALSGLKTAIDTANAAVSRASDKGRFINTKMRHKR